MPENFELGLFKIFLLNLIFGTNTRTWEITVVELDDLKAIMMNQILGEEGLQGVDRGRLIWNDQPKHVFLLTKESLDIEVHDTKSWSDMRKTELNNLEDAIESLGFIPLTVTSLINTLCVYNAYAVLHWICLCPQGPTITSSYQSRGLCF